MTARPTKRSAVGLCATLVLYTSGALAQGGPPDPPRGAPPAKKTSPRGPQKGTQGPTAGDDDDDGPRGALRPEPTPQAPASPLEIPVELREKLRSDDDGAPPSPVGALRRSFFPVYEESRGDYRFRFLPPLYLEHTRGLPAGPLKLTPPGGQDTVDRESLYGLLYYQRRSVRHSADILFPVAWRVRDDASVTYVLGPLAHREAPGEHDNWIAPLAFTGKRADGGYFHFPLLLTSSHWNKDGAFTLIGPYFRNRTAGDVDLGLAPLFFHGDNGDLDGARRTYTLIPPALFFHREHEIDESSLTVVGPVIAQTNPKRSILDVAPLFFSIRGRPETGGVKESHTTLFPLFHYGTSPGETLFAVPGYLRRTTPTVDTLVTPFVVRASKRRGASVLTTVGPVVPLYYGFDESDTGFHARGFFPFYYGDHGPEGRSLWTPLFARFESYGVSRTYWVFPNLTVQKSWKGWETDLHPIVYLGRSESSTHTVIAPIFWDFASPKSRSTVAFPLFWRFADTATEQVTQVAGNTVYLQKRVSGGLDWQFHFLPAFSYGETPGGYWWNVLFGLAGYKREGQLSRIRALWLPITLSGGESEGAR